MSLTEDREVVAARSLLARYAERYDMGDSDPVPVDDIAESFLSLLVRLVPLEEGVSGMLLLREREIRVSAAECELWPERRRFTIAHEIGHWELHADEVSGSFICRRSDVSEATRPKSAEQIREREANGFAAELLMPAARVHADVARHGRDVVAAAKRFEVSTLAMAWRLYNLKHISRKPQRHDYGL